MIWRAICALSLACSSPPSTPPNAKPATQTAPDAPPTPSVQRSTLTHNGAIEFQVFLDNQVYDVIDGAVPGGLTLRRPAQNHWSAHGVSMVHPAAVNLVAEDLSDGVQVTASDDSGANLVVVVKPYLADIEAHLTRSHASIAQTFPQATPRPVPPIEWGSSPTHSYCLQTSSVSVCTWGNQLAPTLAVIATLTRPTNTDDTALIDVLRSLRAGERTKTPELELVHGDVVEPISIGESTTIGESTVRVERRPTVLRRWNGLVFEHDRSFVVTQVPVASMLSLQLNRPGVTVQFFLTRAIEPADVVTSLLVAFPESKAERVSRTIGGAQRTGQRSRTSAGDQTIESEVFAWSVDGATVAVLVQHEVNDDRRAQDSTERVLRSLSVTP